MIKLFVDYEVRHPAGSENCDSDVPLPLLPDVEHQFPKSEASPWPGLIGRQECIGDHPENGSRTIFHDTAQKVRKRVGGSDVMMRRGMRRPLAGRCKIPA